MYKHLPKVGKDNAIAKKTRPLHTEGRAARQTQKSKKYRFAGISGYLPASIRGT
jgi:hypothetical protein